jgi:hypothetical protein
MGGEDAISVRWHSASRRKHARYRHSSRE